MKLRAYILLGGLYGPDGWADSRGMLGLKDQLNGIAGVTASGHAWTDAQAVVHDIRLQSASMPIALIGYSGGGPAAVVVGNALAPRAVKLMVLYDPSPAIQMTIRRVGSNVERAICYFATSRWMLLLSAGLGGGYIRGKAKRIENIHINDYHLAFQYDQILHTRTVNAVRAAIT